MQNINIARHGITDRLKSHWKLFDQLWAAFVPVAKAVLAVQGLVAVEWPNRCKYWRDSRVLRFLAQHAFQNALVAACMYGMRPLGPHAPDEFLGKLWRVSSNSAHSSTWQRWRKQLALVPWEWVG